MIAKDKHPWWKNAVIYEVYLRSFYDSNGDGIGDLPGLISKLDYLQDLGIDAIWLSPVNPSPMVDFGYDITDYYAIEPTYGTMQDFENLVEQAGQRNIYILMDYVFNGTSDQHPWFLNSKSSKKSDKRDWYIWRPGKNGQPPNNWKSIFGGSSWELSPETNEYYYHYFLKEQPDLNYRNSQVQKEMLENIPKFWLNKGIKGFRLDAMAHLLEDNSFQDNPEFIHDQGKIHQINKYTGNIAQNHELLKKLRKTIDNFSGTLLMGESLSEQFHPIALTNREKIAEISQFFGKGDEMHLVMNFFFSYINQFDACKFREQIKLWNNNPANGWPLYLFSNHDAVRHIDRYSKHNQEQAIYIAKLLATLLLTLRGTVQLYYGEEIGMHTYISDPNKSQDPVCKRFWHDTTKCRDGSRTPMQWNNQKNAGFTTGTPWLDLNPDYKNNNVEAQLDDPNSLLNLYKKLIKLKKESPALSFGKYGELDKNNSKILSYSRKSETETFIVILNFTNEKERYKLKNLTLTNPLKVNDLKIIFDSYDLIANNLKHIKLSQESYLELEPFQAFIGQIL